jgi:MFS family permease
MAPPPKIDLPNDEKEALVPIAPPSPHNNSLSITPAQHLWSTFALCVCVLTHSYLLISVFPYAGFMAIDLIDDVNEENAGSYAGFIAASFMAGRAVTSYSWGKWADIYGRVTIIYLSLACSCVFSLLFGMAPSFGWAITFRCLLGFGNGILGSVKTSVSELAGGSEKLETRGMGLVMGMWGWGFLFSPALSGALAEPVKQYPDSELVQQFEGTLSKYPFLLPNLVGALFCVVAMLSLYFFVQETLPADQRRSPRLIPSDIVLWWKNLILSALYKMRRRHPEKIPLSSTEVEVYNATTESATKEENEDPETSIDEEMHDATMAHAESCTFLATAADRVESTKITKHAEMETETTIASLWANQRIRVHLSVYWMQSFLSVSLDEAFPLFCMSKMAGLSLSEKHIGNILSLSGLIFAICQYFVFSTIVNRCGIYKSIRIVTLVQIPVLFAFPISLLLNRSNDNPGELTWHVYAFLGSLVAVYRVSGNVFFSSVSMAINRTVSARQRGTVNGLSVLGGSLAKGLGPAFSGILVATSVSSGFVSPHAGVTVIFSTLGTIAIGVAYSANKYLKEEEKPQQQPL